MSTSLQKLSDTTEEVLQAALVRDIASKEAKKVDEGESNVEEIKEKLQNCEVKLVIKESMILAHESTIRELQKLVLDKATQIDALKKSGDQSSIEVIVLNSKIETLESTINDQQMQLDLAHKESADVEVISVADKCTSPDWVENRSPPGKRKEDWNLDLMMGSAGNRNKKRKLSSEVSGVMTDLFDGLDKLCDYPLIDHNDGNYLARVSMYTIESRKEHQQHFKTIFYELRNQFDNYFRAILEYQSGYKLNALRRLVWRADVGLTMYTSDAIHHLKVVIRSVYVPGLIFKDISTKICKGLDDGLTTAPELVLNQTSIE